MSDDCLDDTGHFGGLGVFLAPDADLELFLEDERGFLNVGGARRWAFIEEFAVACVGVPRGVDELLGLEAGKEQDGDHESCVAAELEEEPAAGAVTLGESNPVTLHAMDVRIAHHGLAGKPMEAQSFGGRVKAARRLR